MLDVAVQLQADPGTGGKRGVVGGYWSAVDPDFDAGGSGGGGGCFGCCCDGGGNGADRDLEVVPGIGQPRCGETAGAGDDAVRDAVAVDTAEVAAALPVIEAHLVAASAWVRAEVDAAVGRLLGEDLDGEGEGGVLAGEPEDAAFARRGLGGDEGVTRDVEAEGVAVG